MTLSSELFLMPLQAAPQSRHRDKAPMANRPESIDRRDAVNAHNNSHDRFNDHLTRDHLSHKTDTRPSKATAAAEPKRITSENIERQKPDHTSTDESRSGSGSNLSAEENSETPKTVPETIHQTMTSPVTVSGTGLLRNQPTVTETHQAAGVPGTDADIAAQSSGNLASHQLAQTEQNITGLASHDPAAPSETKMSPQAVHSAAVHSAKGQNIASTMNITETPQNGMTSEVTATSSDLAGKNALDAATLKAASAQTISVNEETAAQNNVTKSATGHGIDMTGKPAAEDLAKDINSIQQNTAAQNSDKTPVLSHPQNIPAMNAETPKELLGELTARQQQIVAAPIQSPLQKTPENIAQNTKDSVKEFLKSKNKAHADAITGTKQATDSSNTAHAKGTSKDSAEGQYSSQGKASQNAASAANGQLMSAKASSFQAGLTHAMTGGHMQTTQLGGIHPQTGLINIQEVAPANSAAHHLLNSLTSTSHIKPSALPSTPQMVTKQITMAILKQGSSGQNSFKLTLKPAELGQVNIRMDFQADGKMTAAITVDNDRTLNLLQRDQGALGRALENAGFDASGHNMNFTLKKQEDNQGQQGAAGKDIPSEDSDDITVPLDNIISRQQMKMAYSDNALDINI